MSSRGVQRRSELPSNPGGFLRCHCDGRRPEAISWEMASPTKGEIAMTLKMTKKIKIIKRYINVYIIL